MKNRNEIPAKYKWDFTHLFADREAWEKEYAECEAMLPTVAALKGTLGNSAESLYNAYETIYALDKVAPGTANDDTLLYGCESKYYSIRPEFNEAFEMMDNAYIIGDGSGICRGLSQSGAMGIYVADCIGQKQA